MWTWNEGRTFSGTEVTVLLRNHPIDAHLWKDQPLTLVLFDDLRIDGFISDDGTQFVRTSAPDPRVLGRQQSGPAGMTDPPAERVPGVPWHSSLRPPRQNDARARRSTTVVVDLTLEPPLLDHRRLPRLAGCEHVILRTEHVTGPSALAADRRRRASPSWILQPERGAFWRRTLHADGRALPCNDLGHPQEAQAGFRQRNEQARGGAFLHRL